MKTVKQISGIAIVLAFCFTSSLGSALANTPEATASDEQSEHSASVVSATSAETAAETAAVATDQPVKHLFGEGMQIPVDGTSLEAFNQSLESIKTKTTKPEFITLNNAIDYLMVYYIDARRDRTKLAALLNGMTGEQIVALVEW